jgi:hypothetical protein
MVVELNLVNVILSQDTFLGNPSTFPWLVWKSFQEWQVLSVFSLSFAKQREY